MIKEILKYPEIQVTFNSGKSIIEGYSELILLFKVPEGKDQGFIHTIKNDSIEKALPSLLRVIEERRINHFGITSARAGEINKENGK